MAEPAESMDVDHTAADINLIWMIREQALIQ